MGKSTLYVLAIILAALGAAVTAGYPAWGTVTGLAMLLLAVGIAAGALPGRKRSDDYIEDRDVPGKKISNNLVTLSAAAILAVYVAGYHRTAPAADKFEIQAARRRAAVPIAAGVEVSSTGLPGVEVPPAVPPAPISPPRKQNPKSSSTAVRKAKPATPPATVTTTGSGADVVAEAAPVPQVNYKDGTYSGWGRSRHGDIQASVVIQDGKIASTAIAVCATRYPCSWIADLPDEVVTKQSPNVDFVSGATESSDAFSDAVAEALSKASE